MEKCRPYDGSGDHTGLVVHKLTFWEAAMMVVGSTIGSAVLGLAYATRKAGWPVLFIWLIVSAILSTASMLYVAETALRTEKPLQLSGLAQKYIGSKGSWMLFFAVGATSFCSLIAYTNGCGKILSEFLQVSFQTGSLIFIIPATVVVWFGLKATGVAEKFISGGMSLILIVLVAASFIFAKVPFSDIMYTHWIYAMPIFNITVFCFAVQYIVPELSRGLSHAPQQIVPSILVAMIISLAILALVPLSVYLMLPVSEITEVASLSWGKVLPGKMFFVLVNLFGFGAMLTSFWAISESFLTNIIDKFQFKSETDFKTRFGTLIFIVVPPFLLAYYGIVSFVNAIYLAGTLGGIIMSVLPVFMLNAAKRKGDKEPIWQCGWMSCSFIQGLVVAVFCFAGLYSVAGLFGMLPAGW